MSKMIKIGGLTYSKRDLQSELADLSDSGFDYAEIDLESNIKPDKKFENDLNKSPNMLPLKAAHLPQIDFKASEIKKCQQFIQILSKKGVNLFVVHLISNNLPTDKNLELKLSGLKKLVGIAKRHDSMIALENTEEQSDQLEEVLREVPHLKFCLDVGHANLFSKENCSLNLTNQFKDRLAHVHMHDNLGGDKEKDDLHLPIGKGNIDFSAIISKLKDVGYTGNITLEIFKGNKDDRGESIKIIRQLINNK